MVKERLTIEIDTNSVLARALRAEDARPVELLSDGVRYEVVRLGSEPGDEEAAEAFREAMRRAARIFTPEVAERLKQDIYRWREEGTRPIEQPSSTT
jgi:hypothetical protein